MQGQQRDGRDRRDTANIPIRMPGGGGVGGSAAEDLFAISRVTMPVSAPTGQRELALIVNRTGSGNEAKGALWSEAEDSAWRVLGPIWTNNLPTNAHMSGIPAGATVHNAAEDFLYLWDGTELIHLSHFPSS